MVEWQFFEDLLENEDFSDEAQCQCMCNWKFFAYILFM